MKRYVLPLLLTSTMLVAAQAQKPVNLNGIEVIAEETGKKVFAEFQFFLMYCVETENVLLPYQ